MSEPNQHRVYFTITGTFDPEDVTRRLGVLPSSAWRKGDISAQGIERRFSRWSLESRLDRTRPIEEHIVDVLFQLDQDPTSFQAVARELGGYIQLACYFHEGYPGLNFNGELVAHLARYGLGVDFDFYYLWSDHREDA